MDDQLFAKKQQNPSAIEKNFSAAAACYDQAALVQRFAADLVFQKTREHLDGMLISNKKHPSSILEIGCGTGLLTHQLAHAYDWDHYLATDISPAMLSVCKARCLPLYSGKQSNPLLFDVLDANHLKLKNNFDVIVSSFCLQWVNDFFAVLDLLCVKSNLLVISFLLDSSFVNWRHAHAQVGEFCRLQPLISLERLQQWIAVKQNYQGRSISLEKITFTQDFEYPVDFPRSLKAIGAHTPVENTRPSNLRKVLDVCAHPFNVNYDIGLMVLA